MQQQTVKILSIAFFVAVLAWGAYTFVVYLGVPYHAANLLSEQGLGLIKDVCGDGSSHSQLLCRGIVGFFPFISNAIGSLSPLLWYALISAAAYAGFFAWRRAATQEAVLTLHWKPWKVALLCIGVLWMVFTVLTWGAGRDQTSSRFYVEPTTGTYNISENTLAALQSDYQDLLNRGCLEEIGVTESGARAYLYNRSCIQSSFFTRVLPQALFVFLLAFEFLILGGALYSFLRIRRTFTPLVHTLLSVSLGACGLIALLWLFAVLQMYVMLSGWIIVIAIPLIFFRQTLYWFRQFLHHEWTTEHRVLDPQPLLFWMLLTYIAFGFLTVVRPFPIGWDDLGSYLNRPRLLVSYGKFIFSMPGFEWTYLTSLGYLLFGYTSVFGTTASMMVNWFAGILALSSVLVFTRQFLGARSGYLAALLYYALPLVGHFSFADMKIDNAVFTFGTLSLFLAFAAFFTEKAEPESDANGESSHKRFRLTDTHRILFLSGVFVSFAMATKITAAMVFLSVVALILGAAIHWSAFVGGIGLAFLALTFMRAFDVSSVASRILGATAPSWLPSVFTIFLVALSLIPIGYSLYLRPKKLLPVAGMLGALLLGIAISIAPWVEHNNLLVGNVIPKFALGAPNDLSPVLSYRGEQRTGKPGQDVRSLPPELQVDKTNPACVATGSKEELDRYWGFDSGWHHYLTLPWRTVQNLDSTGYYVTTMASLLLFPLLLLLPYFWSKQGRWLRWLMAVTSLLIVEWTFLASGIPWYGIGMFLGLVVALEVFIARAPDVLGRSVSIAFVMLSLLTCFTFRMSQYEQQKNMYDYPAGKISGAALQETTVSDYGTIVKYIMDRRTSIPSRPYVYRIGTFIQYFIPQNLQVIGTTDNQLDNFNCLYAERDPALTIKRLQYLGFNSFVLDLNTATIEQDQNGSLHQKVKLFQDFVNNPASGVQIVVNDQQSVAYMLIP